MDIIVYEAANDDLRNIRKSSSFYEIGIFDRYFISGIENNGIVEHGASW